MMLKGIAFTCVAGIDGLADGREICLAFEHRADRTKFMHNVRSSFPRASVKVVGMVEAIVNYGCCNKDSSKMLMHDQGFGFTEMFHDTFGQYPADVGCIDARAELS